MSKIIATLRNLKGNFDIYAILQGVKEAFENDITTVEDLRRVRKTMANTAFYVRQGKLPQGYGLIDYNRAVENVQTILDELATKFNTSCNNGKAKPFYTYSVEEIMAFDADKLAKYGKSLSSYLCNNGMDAKYEEFYGYYANAMEATKADKITISRGDLQAIVDGIDKMTKKELAVKLQELLNK